MDEHANGGAATAANDGGEGAPGDPAESAAVR